MDKMDLYESLPSDNDQHDSAATIKQHNQKKHGRRRPTDSGDVCRQISSKSSFYKFLARFSGKF